MLVLTRMSIALELLKPQCCTRKEPIHIHVVLMDNMFLTVFFFLLYVIFSSVRADVLAHTCLGLGSGALFITSTLYRQILTRRASMTLPVPEPESEDESEPETITEPNSDDSDVPNEIASPDTPDFDDMPALIPITQGYFKKDFEIVRLLELIRQKYEENNVILANYRAISSEGYVQTEPQPVQEPVQPVQPVVQADPVAVVQAEPVAVVQEPVQPVQEPVQAVQEPVQPVPAKPVNSVVQVGTNQELLSKYSNERRLSFCYPC